MPRTRGINPGRNLTAATHCSGLSRQMMSDPFPDLSSSGGCQCGSDGSVRQRGLVNSIRQTGPFM